MDEVQYSLLGTWQLVRWEITYGNGRAPSLPFGAQATGLILYAADGWMNACIARGGRARLSGESVRSAPEGECLAAFESFFQYAGRCEVRTAHGQQQAGAQRHAFAQPQFRRHPAGAEHDFRR